MKFCRILLGVNLGATIILGYAVYQLHLVMLAYGESLNFFARVLAFVQGGK